MTTSAWGGSFGEAPNSAWGDSFGFEGFVPPVVVTPPTVFPGGGSLYWKRYQEELSKKKLPKKKRKLLEELDEALVELHGRIEEAEVKESIENEALKTFRLSQEIFTAPQITEITLESLRAQIAIVKRAIEEIDDEEVIILALH